MTDQPGRHKPEPLRVTYRYEPIPGRLTEVQIELLERRAQRLAKARSTSAVQTDQPHEPLLRDASRNDLSDGRSN
jgi:hypothetical protein